MRWEFYQTESIWSCQFLKKWKYLLYLYYVFCRAAAPEGAGDLRSSVTNLLDAMQNLLGGLHLPELPQDADASDESDDDEEWQ